MQQDFVIEPELMCVNGNVSVSMGYDALWDVLKLVCGVGGCCQSVGVKWLEFDCVALCGVCWMWIDVGVTYPGTTGMVDSGVF